MSTGDSTKVPSAGGASAPLRVLVVVNSFPTASETFIFNKVLGLSERGVAVTVLSHSLRNDYALYASRLRDAKIQVRCLHVWNTGPLLLGQLLLLLLREPLVAWEMLKQTFRGFRGKRPWPNASGFLGTLIGRRFDIVHFEFSGIAVGYMPYLGFLKPAKMFVSCRGTAEQVKPLADLRRAADLVKLFASADRVHCVSKEVLRSCARHGLREPKAFVNEPAIRPEMFTRAEPCSTRKTLEGTVRICSTGRLDWKKGFEFGLVAMRELLDRGLKFHWEIIGEGPEREKLVYIIHTLNLGQVVTLVGKVSSAEVRNRLASCDIFLLPSLSEGISNAALEAMAMELPVVSTRAGGMEEVIQHDHNGLLVDCFSASAIALSIRRLIDDPELRERLSVNAKKTILEKFSIPRQIDRFLFEYHAVRKESAQT